MLAAMIVLFVGAFIYNIYLKRNLMAVEKLQKMDPTLDFKHVFWDKVQYWCTLIVVGCSSAFIAASFV